jgi:NADPH:quinone reductase-like Zn-dependent oxidoreductase
MKYWRASGFGEPREVLRLEERELSPPGDGIVELRVEATGVGLPDVLMTRGSYPAVRKPPVTPGQEIAGTVTRVGAGCTLKPGDAAHRLRRRDHEALCALAEAGKIRTPIDRVFPFEQVPEAIERVGSNQAVGKVIVRGTV